MGVFHPRAFRSATVTALDANRARTVSALTEVSSKLRRQPWGRPRPPAMTDLTPPFQYDFLLAVCHHALVNSARIGVTVWESLPDIRRAPPLVAMTIRAHSDDRGREPRAG